MFRNSLMKSGHTLRMLAICTIMVAMVITTARQSMAASATAGMLQGHLSLEGQPSITRTGLSRNLDIVMAGNGVSQSFTGTANTNGTFSVALPATLPAGTYEVWVKSPKFLAAAQMGVVYDGITANVDMGTLVAGDCNNDNLVTVADYAILRNTYGKALGDTGYDARADFNEDSIVSIMDFNLFRNKIGLGGAPRP
jgi:hypothetical protein